MSLQDFRDELDDEIASILDTRFQLILTPTESVPSVNDPAITYPNLDTMQQRCKVITTCVLHVDIRGSTDMGQAHRRETMTKLYSAFVRGMMRCAMYYGGHVRHIVGDRITVFFDSKDCFYNAIKTAELMNSFARFILNKHFTHDEVRCGIGVDYGTMIVAKVGLIRRGNVSSSYHDLVWLGRPANVASKLADQGNKVVPRRVVQEGHHYRFLKDFSWVDVDMETFLGRLKPISLTNTLEHSNPNFFAFTFATRLIRNEPILVTESVFKGFTSEHPTDDVVTGNYFKPQSLKVPGYSGTIYGGDFWFTVFNK